MWVMKKLKMDWNEAADQRLNGLNDLDEFHIKSYESSSLYKEKMKKYHDQEIEKREFIVGDSVLLLTLGCTYFWENRSPNGLVHS